MHAQILELPAGTLDAPTHPVRIGPATLYAALAAALYARWLSLPFASDDFIWLYEGGRVDSVTDLFRIRYFDFIRPTSTLFFWLVQRVAGLNPVVCHAAALALYAATALMLHVLVRRVTGREAAGYASGVLFLLFRDHIESVTWSAAVGEVLAGFFMVATVLQFLDLRDRPTAGRRVATLCLLVAALCAKESAIVLPVLLLLADVLVPSETPGGMWQVVTRQMPFWAAAAVTVSWEFAAILAHGGFPDMGAGGLATTATGARAAQGMLAAVVTRPLAPGVSATGTLAVAALLYTAFVAWAVRHARPAAFFALWLGLACLPYAFFVAHDALYDRYSYLPTLGLAGAIGCLIATPVRAPAIAALAVLGAWNVHGILAGNPPLYRDQAERTIPGLLARLTPSGIVYAYAPHTHEHYVSRAVSLYGGVPLDRIRDWYELLGLDGLRRGDVALFYDVYDLAWVDVTGPVREMLAAHRQHLGEPTADGVWKLSTSQCVRTWDFHNTNDAAEWVAMGGLRREADAFATPGAAGFLAGPVLGLNPLPLYLLQVRCRVRAGGQGAVLRLGWSTRRSAGFGPRTTEARALDASGKWQALEFFPSDRAAWCTGGEVQRLYLVLSTTPATVEVDRVDLFAFPRGRQIRP